MPEWVELVPKGPDIEAMDGRKFRCSNPQKVVDEFNAHPNDIPVDYEHASEIKGPDGEPAPACGWISLLEVRDGSIWGKVAWTDKGSASLLAKEYRYISPAFAFHKKSLEILSLVSAGLTNRPALVMHELARSSDEDNDAGNVGAHMEKPMDPKLLALLGLAADATVDQVLTAIASMQASLVSQKTVAEKLTADLATARAVQPSLDKFVPRSDYDAALARSKSLEDEKIAADKKAHDDAASAEVDAAMKAGKVTPASKDFYLATCSTKEGLEKFRDFVKSAPVVGEPSKLEGAKPPAGGEPKATDEDLAIAARCGISKERYIAELGK